MRLRLLYHGQCFDGVASAAVFTRFYRARLRSDAEVEYTPLFHHPGALFDGAMFDGDENAIVDFKYSPSGRLTWWFDHHQSAFLSPADEAHFRADTSGRKFWDAESKSCTEFIERVARERFGFEDSSLAPPLGRFALRDLPGEVTVHPLQESEAPLRRQCDGAGDTGSGGIGTAPKSALQPG